MFTVWPYENRAAPKPASFAPCSLAPVALEVAGQRRHFGVKVVSGMLFFREVGRDETWTFRVEMDDQPLPSGRACKDEVGELLKGALHSGNYGRFLWLQLTTLQCDPPCS